MSAHRPATEPSTLPTEAVKPRAGTTPRAVGTPARGVRAVQAQVAEFHATFGRDVRVPIAEAPDELIDLRIDLIAEELEEAVTALRDGDRLCIARELADLAYVVAGAAVDLGENLTDWPRVLGSLVADCGMATIALALRSREIAHDLNRVMGTLYRYAEEHDIDLDLAVVEVHRANMSKIGPDGRPRLRDDGKILKGPGFSPPDMSVAVRNG